MYRVWRCFLSTHCISILHIKSEMTHFLSRMGMCTQFPYYLNKLHNALLWTQVTNIRTTTTSIWSADQCIHIFEDINVSESLCLWTQSHAIAKAPLTKWEKTKKQKLTSFAFSYIHIWRRRASCQEEKAEWVRENVSNLQSDPSSRQGDQFIWLPQRVSQWVQYRAASSEPESPIGTITTAITKSVSHAKITLRPNLTHPSRTTIQCKYLWRYKHKSRQASAWCRLTEANWVN